MLTALAERAIADVHGRTAGELVAQLQNIYAGPQFLPSIIALGAAAIPALETCLRGPSQALHHPRALAADALAALGGRDGLAALIRGLRDSIARDVSAAFREAEEVVVSHITDPLSRHPTPEGVQALLQATAIRHYPACARALGRIQDPRAIPLLVECLREDAARPAAMESLRHFGAAALDPLRLALASPMDVGGLEPPSHLDGRAAAATLLGELDDTSALTRALNDQERSIRITAALSLVRAHPDFSARATRLLLQGLDDPDWLRAQTVMESLLRFGARIGQALDNILAIESSDADAQRRRRRAATLTGRLGLTSAAPRLATLAAAADPKLRLSALEALILIPGATESQLALFVPDADLMVAARALQALHGRSPVGWRHVRRLLKSSPRWPSIRQRWPRLIKLWAVTRRMRRHSSGA